MAKDAATRPPNEKQPTHIRELETRRTKADCMKEGYKERRAAKHEAEKAKREEGWYPIHIIVGQAYPRADIAARAARLGGLFTLAEAQMELLLCLPDRKNYAS
jgi:hypothetical protein